MALSGVFTVLEQGAKSPPQSRQWFGRKKRERNEDPLLQYLHQARNADEHGIDPVSIWHPSGVAVSGNGTARIEDHNDGDFHLVVEKKTVGQMTVTVTQPVIRLITVRDSRFGTTYDPPTEHLGTPLDNNAPMTVAELGLAYVRCMVGEADIIAKKTSIATSSKG